MKITLTFDDGPTEYTPAILDILKKEKIKSTFFVLGKNLETHTQIAKRAIAQGHIVANHGFSHNRITSPLGLNYKEIQKTQHLLEKINPKSKKIYRPPYGILSLILKRKLIAGGYKIVMFDIVGNDWQKNISADKITENVISKLFNGAIIVLHDGFGSNASGDRSKTVAALPQIIQKAKILGYKFTSPVELNG